MRFIGRLGRYWLYSDRLLPAEYPSEDFFEAKQDDISGPAGSFTFDYGPVAGGLIESVRIRLNTYGEYIRRATLEPKKIRTVKVTGNVQDALLGIERVNGNFAASHAVAFLIALEKASSTVAPPAVQLSRVLQIELERIRNHVFVIHRIAETAGFSVPAAELLYIMEKVNRVIGRVFGHRYFYGVNGFKRATTGGGINLTEFEQITEEFQEVFRGLLESRIFIDRLQGNGVVTDSRSIGPTARAAGFEYDARLDGDYSTVYAQLGYRLLRHSSPDAFGRLLIRGEEVAQSLALIRSAVEKREEFCDDAKPDDASVEGIGLGRIESPSGDLAYSVNLHDGRLIELSLLPPSVPNIRLFLESVVSSGFTDVPFNWESFGIWMSEVGVKFV